MRRRIPLIVIVLSLMSARVSIAADAFTELTPFSTLECVSFEDGSRAIARKLATGRQLLSTEAIKKEVSSDLSSLRRKNRTLQQLRRSDIRGTFDQLDLRSLKNIINEAFLEPGSAEAQKFLAEHPRVKLFSKKERQDAIDAALKELSYDLQGKQAELDALLNCLQGSPPALSLRLFPIYRAGTYEIIVLADLVAKKKLKPGYAFLYCVMRSDGKAYQVYFSKDPCSIISGYANKGNCPEAAVDGERTISGIVGEGSEGSATKGDTNKIQQLLVSTFSGWRGVTVKAKPASSTTDCYTLFK